MSRQIRLVVLTKKAGPQVTRLRNWRRGWDSNPREACTTLEGGKIVEGWNNWDTLGMMQQLGVVPQMAAAAKA
jgi:hypothetical protein